MRKYEIMLILPPDADDSVVGGISDRIGQLLGRGGGEIMNVDRWGRRRLAYEIDRQAEGYYVVIEANADPASVKELDRVLSLADEVIRFKVVVREAA
jgi:small subunit ribosomal protein S6